MPTKKKAVAKSGNRSIGRKPMRRNMKKDKTKRTPRQMKSAVIDLAAVYKRNPELLFKDQPGGLVNVIDMRDLDNFYQIDAWAAELWRCLDGKANVSKIFETLKAKSKLDDALLRREGSRVLSELAELGLIHRV